jgi:hypothetical protein
MAKILIDAGEGEKRKQLLPFLESFGEKLLAFETLENPKDREFYLKRMVFLEDLRIPHPELADAIIEIGLSKGSIQENENGTLKVHQSALEFLTDPKYFGADETKIESQERTPDVRSEVRKIEAAIVPGEAMTNLADAVVNGGQITEAEAENTIVVIKIEGFDWLRERLHKALMERNQSWHTRQEISGTKISDEAFKQAAQDLLETLQLPIESKTPERAGIIGLVLPENMGDSFTENFFEAIKSSRIETVAFVGKVPDKLTSALKEQGQNFSTLKNLTRPMMAIDQAAIPTGILDSELKSEINESFVPFWIDMEGVSDPLVRDYVEQLQIVALVHTARLIAARPELLKNRSELRAELLKNLALQGFDNIITAGQNFGREGFAISAVIAQAYLEARSELLIQQAA